jgi:hypothetical protein
VKHGAKPHITFWLTRGSSSYSASVGPHWLQCQSEEKEKYKEITHHASCQQVKTLSNFLILIRIPTKKEVDFHMDNISVLTWPTVGHFRGVKAKQQAFLGLNFIAKNLCLSF